MRFCNFFDLYPKYFPVPIYFSSLSIFLTSLFPYFLADVSKFGFDPFSAHNLNQFVITVSITASFQIVLLISVMRSN